MALVDKLYGWLANGPTPDADHILSAGLAHAEGAYRTRIIDVLLTRRSPASWGGLVVHWESLEPQTREALHADQALLHLAIGEAMKTGLAGARHGALLALSEAPTPRLAYLLPDALRDTSSRTRALAGQVLKTTVAAFLNEPPRDGDGGADRAAERELLIRAVREAFLTFDAHYRVESLEAAAWLARDVEEMLWQQIESRRSRTAIVIADHLEQWNEPQLAAFCLMALGKSNWRPRIVRKLAGWKREEHVEALLRHSDLLDRLEIRQNLARLRDPAWGDLLGRMADRVEPRLRECIPRWVASLGIDDRQKLRLLSAWAEDASEGMRRQAVYALAQINDPQADELLSRVAEGEDAPATFARWVLESQRGPARQRAVSAELQKQAAERNRAALAGGPRR